MRYTDRAQTDAADGGTIADPPDTSATAQSKQDTGSAPTARPAGMSAQAQTARAGSDASPPPQPTPGGSESASGGAGAGAQTASTTKPVTGPVGGSTAQTSSGGRGGGTAASTGGVSGNPGAASEPESPFTADPVIPQVAGECPVFQEGTITFMGLSGITISEQFEPDGPSAPMLFYWHGENSRADELGTMAAELKQSVITQRGVVIAFDGTSGGDLLSGTAIFGKGDLAIADQLVACAVRDRKIDPRRIYTTGCGGGGLFATAQAVKRSSYIAAAAPNSGGISAPLQFDSVNSPALMTLHGASGTDVSILDFAKTSADADKLFKSHGGFVIDCDHGGGHCGASSLVTATWQFFSVHVYGVKPKPWLGGPPSGFPASCKVY